MKENELKPCPFCGATENAEDLKDRVRVANDHFKIVNGVLCELNDVGFWRVVCHRCGVMTSPKKTKEDAIEKWNMREG